MDSITHVLLGVCTAQLVTKNKLGKKSLFWCAVANSIPDIDGAGNLWLGVADSMLFHRGLTHSIFFCIVISPLLAFLPHWLHRTGKEFYGSWLALIASGMFLHVLVDSLAVYGTGWFEPFNSYRVSFNSIYIVDPLFTLPLLAGGLIIIFRKPVAGRINKIAYTSLGISVLYLMITFTNKVKANEAMENSLTRIHASNENYFTTPTPFNTFLWYAVASVDSGFYIGYYSVFDKSDLIQLEFYSKDSINNVGPARSKEVETLKKFSQGYFLIEPSADTLLFKDLRMGKTGGWYQPASREFTFQYYVYYPERNKVILQRGRAKDLTIESMLQLWKRLKGI